MKRLLLGILFVFFFTCAFSETVEAKPPQTKTAKAKSSKRSAKRASKKKKKKGAKSSKISPALGNVKWGMSEQEVLTVVIKNVKERYKPLIAKTKDAVEDDRLRIKERAEIDRIKKSLVRFDGQSTGWDLGFLRDEFTHNNGESMLVVKDFNSQNFYFFIDGKLWKWYKALDSKVFGGKGYNAFASALQRKFGEAKQIEGELVPGAEKRKWLEWEDRKTRLRAIDQTSFYGFFCLVFEEKDTVGRLASIRTNAPKRGAKKHALVEAVTSEADMAADPDQTPNIVDRITGQLRQREDIPSPDSASSGSNADFSSPATAKEDDPLMGL
jgi:hypothetical protein